MPHLYVSPHRVAVERDGTVLTLDLRPAEPQVSDAEGPHPGEWGDAVEIDERAAVDLGAFLKNVGRALRDGPPRPMEDAARFP